MKVSFRGLSLFVVGGLTLCGCSAGSGGPTVGPASPPPATATAGSTIALPSPAPPSPPLPASGLIVFVVESGPNGDDVKNLWTIHPDGTGAVALTHVTDEQYGNPSFSADGQRILAEHCVASAPCVITSMNLTGGDLQVVPGPIAWVGQPAMSPDGKWVAWTESETDGGHGSIFVAHPDGSDRHRIADPISNPDHPDGGPGNPAFSPDGRSLAVNVDGIVHVVALDGTGDVVISPAGKSCKQGRWSPDGAHVLTSCDGRLLLLALDGSAPRDLGLGDEPAFSPDGQWIAYRRWLPGTAHIGLVVARADGSDPIEIWQTPERQDIFVVEPAWGP